MSMSEVLTGREVRRMCGTSRSGVACQAPASGSGARPPSPSPNEPVSTVDVVRETGQCPWLHGGSASGGRPSRLDTSTPIHRARSTDLSKWAARPPPSMARRINVGSSIFIKRGQSGPPAMHVSDPSSRIPASSPWTGLKDTAGFVRAQAPSRHHDVGSPRVSGALGLSRFQAVRGLRGGLIAGTLRHREKPEPTRPP